MTATDAQTTKPNVLVFFCDQLRPDLLGCYGGDMVRTPQHGRAGRGRTLFENGYTPTAICSPARASMMTGCMPTSTTCSTTRRRGTHTATT